MTPSRNAEGLKIPHLAQLDFGLILAIDCYSSLHYCQDNTCCRERQPQTLPNPSAVTITGASICVRSVIVISPHPPQSNFRDRFLKQVRAAIHNSTLLCRCPCRRLSIWTVQSGSLQSNKHRAAL